MNSQARIGPKPLRTWGVYRSWLTRSPRVAGQSSPASQRSPDCHRTLASTTDRPRLSPPPLPPAFRPQHQPLSGLRAAPARPPELADVIATQCTRHQAPRIRCLSLFGEGPGARPTAAPSHRGPFRRIHAPSDPPLTVARSLASTRPLPPVDAADCSRPALQRRHENIEVFFRRA